MIPNQVERENMSLPDDVSMVEELPPSSRLVVAAIVKHAFGMAIGTVCALGLGGLAAVGVFVEGRDEAETFTRLIGRNFLPGYAPNWIGVVVGVAWGFGGGYALGFLTALARNRTLKFLFWMDAVRARLSSNRTVLDDLS